MNGSSQSTAMPQNTLVAATASASAADVISPAEAQFWQEWAEKAPALMQKGLGEVHAASASAGNYKLLGVAVGAVLGGATLTKYVPGKWKIASGLAAAGSVLAGVLAGSTQSTLQSTAWAVEASAEELARNPELTKRLADYLSVHVKAEDIQEKGLEQAVLGHALAFVGGRLSLGMHAPAHAMGVNQPALAAVSCR